jgi:hypothetical protein
MAARTLVNSRITDAVTQQNVSVLASAPAMAMATIYQAQAHSLSILFQNATAAQKHAAICGQAASNMGVMQLYSSGSTTAAAAAAKVAKSDQAERMLLLLLAARLLR